MSNCINIIFDILEVLMNEIKFDYEKAKGFVSETEIQALAPYVKVEEV